MAWSAARQGDIDLRARFDGFAQLVLLAIESGLDGFLGGTGCLTELRALVCGQLANLAHNMAQWAFASEVADSEVFQNGEIRNALDVLYGRLLEFLQFFQHGLRRG